VATIATDPQAALSDPPGPDSLYEVIDGRIVEKVMGVYKVTI
jgi:hypothetical protein